MNLFRVATASTLACLFGGLQAHASDDTTALATDLRSDAAVRTSILDQDAKAFAPKVSGYVLTRFNANYRSDSNLDANGNNVTQGAQLAYTKMVISGNIYDESWGYGIQFKFSESTGAAILDDAFVTFKPEDQYQFKVGQFKIPLLREENISDAKQLSANRSVMNSVFTQSRSQGVMMTWTGDNTRAWLCFNDGMKTVNADYNSNVEADYGYSGRVEYKWDGDWKQYDEFTSFQGSPYFGAVSASAEWQTGGDTLYTPDVQTFEGVVDVMVKGNGWNLYGAVVGRSTHSTIPALPTVVDWGIIAQAGYFVSPKWELFARFDSVIPDSTRVNNDTFNTITIGATKYIVPNSHALKFTIDVELFLDEQSLSIAPESTLTGLLASTEKDQWALQAQLQFMF